MSVGKLYLIAYNAVLVGGWAIVLVKTIQHALSCNDNGACDAAQFADLEFYLQVCVCVCVCVCACV